MKRLFPNAAAVLLAVAMPAYAQTSNTKPAARGAPSAAEAKAFVDNAERDLANVSVYANKAQWVYETYINADTSFLTAKSTAENTALGVKYAKAAAGANAADGAQRTAGPGRGDHDRRRGLLCRRRRWR
jgi:peptidyl-dipeptidase A